MLKIKLCVVTILPSKGLSNYIFTLESFMISKGIGAPGAQVSFTLLWF